MTLVSTKSPPPRSARAIVQRTRGRAQGFATRLMSPSDFGEILKPFVFLDLFDHEGVTTRKCSECTTSGTLSELRPPVE